jgi:hypothetical protein
MPYADVEKRRQFQREYKRRWRKAQEKINPLRAFRVYICPRFPFFRLARVSFDNGFLITRDVAVQAEVERHHEFSRFIFPLAMDLTCTPTED